ncbi:hypothetical protein CIPAW_07G024800 [Carya illinoinensis]|uniref:Uncharacterized protein n=2 Tax=Carya illinoinensis TaxID=32201 RepID=A0A8T1PWU3_CARIL|nr:hypothetical protein CIPAW_07G024800 [Carya illinoinensis]
MSLTSPQDVCRSVLLSSLIRFVADSDTVWEKFLPPNYEEILSRLVSPFVYSSKKELFARLSNPQLIDGDRKIFSIEKSTGKKCYMLSARDLSIKWASHPLYWSWKPLPQSRFAEVAELRTISWLEILGLLNTNLLSPRTLYGTYLIVHFANRAYGLDTLPSEVSLEVGNVVKSQGTVYLSRSCDSKKQFSERLCCVRSWQRSKFCSTEKQVPVERKDGWMEIELGQFYNDHQQGDEEVRMCLKEVKGEHLKGGLIVEGIELRPIQLH